MKLPEIGMAPPSDEHQRIQGDLMWILMDKLYNSENNEFNTYKVMAGKRIENSEMFKELTEEFFWCDVLVENSKQNTLLVIEISKNREQFKKDCKKVISMLMGETKCLEGFVYQFSEHRIVRFTKTVTETSEGLEFSYIEEKGVKKSDLFKIDNILDLVERNL